MDQGVERLRGLQKRLHVCSENMTDPQKVLRLKELILELRRMEESMMFTSVENVQVVSHLTPVQTNLRVSYDEGKVSDVTNPEQSLLDKTKDEKVEALNNANASRILATLFRVSQTLPKEEILQLIQTDPRVDEQNKQRVFELVMREYQDVPVP